MPFSFVISYQQPSLSDWACTRAPLLAVMVQQSGAAENLLANLQHRGYAEPLHKCADREFKLGMVPDKDAGH